jgi:diketogulonate reductase-like aldo/keto reductase
MKLELRSCVSLNNGVQMPVLGLGTWASTGKKGRQAVLWALAVGYRLFDTASSYGNEQEIGEAIKASGLPRNEVFITTKVWPGEYGYEATLKAFESSRSLLGLEQVDLYLLHWPGDDRRRRIEAWRALETLLADGRARAIGVSNYGVPELEEILQEGDGREIPSVNQVSYSPFNQQRQLCAFCAENGIRIEGYSPLTRGRKLGDRVVRAVAEARGRTPAQVLIRWALQKEVVTIPKAVHQDHIAENAAVFDFSLTAEDMAGLDALDEER